MKISLLDIARDHRAAKTGHAFPVVSEAGISREQKVGQQFENTDELDKLDSAIAAREGYLVAEMNSSGKAVRPDQSPYQPTRDFAEAFRLMEKYVVRMDLSQGIWCAVGHNGRAYSGRTALIAICRAAAG